MAALPLMILVLVPGLAVPAAARADPVWQLEQPSPPPGARFKVPLGAPGDLQFQAPNEGLLSVEGNATIPRGLLFYDGRGWHQLSRVCGDTADTSRVAWASPDEFWVVTQPSYPRYGSGLGLCHFKNGAVIGSYSTPIDSPDPFQPMDAAWCHGRSDCWFAGAAAQDPQGARAGSFELHWDGNTLTSSYSPQGRGISAIGYYAGGWNQTAFAGAQRENRSDPLYIGADEPYGPELLRSLGADGVWRGVNFLPRHQDGIPQDGTELLALSGDASHLWLAGGGAASGPDAPAGQVVPRGPFAAYQSGSFFQELSLDPNQFGLSDRFVSIAAVPGTGDAWVAVQPFADRASTTAKARVALLHPDGSAQEYTLPGAGAGRGSAAHIACPAAGDCWMVTSAGWLFHLSDGTRYAQNTDPYWTSSISSRPNEAAAQFVPDTPPPDDSLPPRTVYPKQTRKRRVIPPFIKNIRRPKVYPAPKLHGYALVLTLYVVRAGRLQLLAYRHKQLVAKTRLWRVRRGPATFRLLLHRNRWPTSLAFVIVDGGKRYVVGGPGHPAAGNGGRGGPSTISTSGDIGGAVAAGGNL